MREPNGRSAATPACGRENHADAVKCNDTLSAQRVVIANCDLTESGSRCNNCQAYLSKVGRIFFCDDISTTNALHKAHAKQSAALRAH